MIDDARYLCIHFLQGIDNLNDIGCFGLTELGYGNNAVEMETTATYDNETKEFIVNTPHPLAQVILASHWSILLFLSSHLSEILDH